MPNWKNVKNDACDIIIAIGVILCVMAVIPVHWGWTGVFMISSLLYLMYVIWPVRYRVLSNIKRDWQQLMKLIDEGIKNDRQKLLDSQSGDGRTAETTDAGCDGDLPTGAGSIKTN